MKRILFLVIISLVITSCVERGKPIQKEETTTIDANKKKVAHYTCPNGHKGADKQGRCVECNAILVHNQGYHGNNLAIPKPALQDPFSNVPAPNSTPSPAQNAYGDYHYTCPNGHAGGSGTAGNCSSCGATLTHNQLYHK